MLPVRQHHDTGTVRLTLSASGRALQRRTPATDGRLTSPSGDVQTASTPLAAGNGTLALDVADPQLWWPNGYGDQPLYTLTLLLQSGAKPLDTRTYQSACAPSSYARNPTSGAPPSRFVVNGLPIFAKGSDWIPAELLPHPDIPRPTRASPWLCGRCKP